MPTIASTRCTQSEQTIAFDTETTGLRLHGPDYMFAYSTCTDRGKKDIHRLDGPATRRLINKEVLEKFWNNTSITKTCHNAKFDLTASEKFLGKRLDDHKIHCTFLMSHLLRNNFHSHKLDDLAWILASYPKEASNMIKKYTKKVGNYHKVPEHHMQKYQADDAERCMLLHCFFLPKIQADRILTELYETEINLMWTTLRMEQRGVYLDIQVCKDMIEEYNLKLDVIKDDIEEQTEPGFKFGSPVQLRRWLFGEYKLPILKRTPKGLPSVDKHTLLELQENYNNPLLDLILQHRSYTKGIANFKTYLELVDDNGILHPNINTCGAVTGRESCDNPNLQQVEKEVGLLNPFAIPARKAFRPKPEYVNFHIDYSGIEMRLLLHYSGDQELLNIANSGGDVHEPACHIFFGNQFENAKDSEYKTLRDASKNANFAKPYGAAPAKIALILNMPLNTVTQRVREYERRFPKLSNLSYDVRSEVLDYGYVTTVFGRKLYLSKESPHKGINYKIQGTAAEILKRAQIRVHKYLEKATGGEAGIILPIHDEIVVEYPRKRLKDAQDIIPNIINLMQDFPQFKVPILVDVEVSTDCWARKVSWNGN